MPDISRKPDEQDSSDMSSYLRRMWLPVHDRWRSGPDPWYHQTARIWEKDGKRSTRPNIVPPEARAIIDHGTDVFLTFVPTFHREPVGNGENKEEDADDVEAAALALFMDTQLRQMTIPFKAAAHYMNKYDYSVIEGPMLHMSTRPVEPKEEDYDDEEQYRWARIDYLNSKRFWNPISISAPHPASVLLDPASKEPEEAVIPKALLVRDIRRMLDDARKRSEIREDVEINQDIERYLPDRRYEELKVTEFWNKDWHWVTLDSSSEMVYLERNSWGFLPYVHGFGGYSYLSTTSTMDGSNTWLTEMCQGLLDPLIDMLYMDAQGMAAKHNALVDQGFPRPGHTRDAAEARDQLANPDGVLEGDASEWWWYQVPELNRSVFQIGEDVKAQLAVGSFVRDVAGFRQQGVTTVGQQAILTQAANRKFDAAKVTLDQMVTHVARNMLRLVDRLDEKLHAGGRTLDPAQIHHDYNIVGEFQVIDPVLQLQKREMGLREMQQGAKSRETYWQDDLRIPNVTEEKKRLYRQYIEDDPIIKDMLVEAEAEEMGIIDLWEKRRQQMQAAQRQQAPGDGPRISDQAGGGAPRALNQALTGDVANPDRTDIPPEGI